MVRRGERPGGPGPPLNATALDPARSYKPLEVGNGLVMATVSPTGRLLSIGRYHPEHGVVELTEHPPFAESRRYEPAAVRAYRAALADPGRPGFGVELGRPTVARTRLVGDAAPESLLEFDGLRVTVRTVAPAGLPGVLQTWRFESTAPRDVHLAWTGEPELRRAAYAQLTEGGPLPPAPRVEGEWWRLWSEPVGEPLRLGPDGAREVRVAVGFDRAPSPAQFLAMDAEVIPAAGEDAAARRALAYARVCCLRVAPNALCILADHQILPLSWNRDAYYVATLLREHGEDGLVRDHLRWLFRVARRRDGLWGRSHLANGLVKDPAFQLDQQCYPILEAAEAGETATYAEEIGEVLRSLDRRRAGDLYPTAETPADDPLSLPYHFSSHVLLWRTFAALRDAGVAVDPEPIRRAVLRAFADRGRFAYATDAKGGFRHYHDANDLPTALAPEWGFCAAEDRRWRATVDFAWSDENEGYWPGPLGGLGSVHTPHPWPLGDAQEIVVARALRDEARAQRVGAKLARVATWDLLYPEAYDERTGEVRSRHWFAWPAAFLSSRASRRRSPA